MTAAEIRRVDILGVHVSAINMAMALDEITRWIDQKTSRYVCVNDVHAVMEAQRCPEVRRIHNASGLTTPDGMPLVWAGRYAGARHMDRVYGPDLMLAVSSVACDRKWRFYLYGGKEGVPERLAQRLIEAFPSLEIVGTWSPPFRPLTEQEDEEAVIRINAARPDVVWVGLGTPKQERWMASHIGRLDAPVLIGVGAAFDMHAGVVRQAPIWLQRTGFEWLFRAVTEPRRLAGRYARNNAGFLVRLLRRPPRLVSRSPPG